MDFRLNEEQLMMQKTARDFAQKEIKPVAAYYDSRPDPKDRFPWELWKKLHNLGFLQLPIDPEWGGTGTDLLTQVVICEEIGAGDGSFGKAYGTALQKSHYLNSLLSDEQKKEFLKKFIEDDTYVIASAITEPDSSSDNLLPYDAPTTIRTFAYRDGDEYVINGFKHFVTLSAVASLFFLWARTKKDVPISQGLSCFLVPADTPGVSLGRIDDTLGSRSLAAAEIIFDDVRIPTRHLLGEENGMLKSQQRIFVPDYLNTTAAELGEARTCYEETKEHAKERIQGGKPIIEHINIGMKILDMHIGIEASRTLLQKVAWSFDTQNGFDRKMVYMAKAFVSDIISKIHLDSLEVWAGYGIQKDLPIERYFRNHFAAKHGGGTPDMNRIKSIKYL